MPRLGEPDQRDREHQQPDHGRKREDADRDVAQRRHGRVVDEDAALGDRKGEPARDPHHRQRRDQRLDPPIGDREAAEEPAGASGEHGEEGRRKESEGYRRSEDDGGERHDRRHGQVESAADHHQELRDGEQSEKRRLRQKIADVLRREEGRADDERRAPRARTALHRRPGGSAIRAKPPPALSPPFCHASAFTVTSLPLDGPPDVRRRVA